MHVLNTQEIKNAMSRFATGVTVVTTRFMEQDWGMTCNSFNTVSLDPPLVMWCIRKSSQSHTAFTQGEGYVVNVLAANQKNLALKFTQGSHEARFLATPFARTSHNVARLEGVSAWFDCTLEQVVSAGDHDILIGRVRGVGTDSANGLVYMDRQFGAFAPQAS